MWTAMDVARVYVSTGYSFIKLLRGHRYQSVGRIVVHLD
jgi:hypothetical protein